MPQLNLQEQHSDPNTHSAIVPMITGSVEQQTLEGNVGTTNLGDNFASTSDASNLSQHEKKRVSRDKPEHFVHQVKAQKPQGTAYDVATLLELGKATDTTRVQLAFNKEVLAESMFKDPNTGLYAFDQKVMPIRGLCLYENNMNDNLNNGRALRFVHQPFRQPNGPPATPLAQRDEGFARFLKQHASPPHQRVNAGGNIVPAGPLLSPPAFNMDSMLSAVHKRPVMAQPARDKYANASSSTDQDQLARSQVESSTSSGHLTKDHTEAENRDYLNMLARVHGVPQPSYGTDVGVPQTPIFSPQSSQAYMAPVLHFPPGAVPVIYLQDGGAIISFEGNMYRASLHGLHTRLEQLYPLQTPSIAEVAPGYPMMGPYQPVSFGLQRGGMVEATPVSLPFAAATNRHSANTSKPNYHLQLKALEHNQGVLRSQLELLDQHLALHRHDLGSGAQSSATTMRVQLVEQIDTLRVSREKLRSLMNAPTSVGDYPLEEHRGYQYHIGRQDSLQSSRFPAGIDSNSGLISVDSQMPGFDAPVSFQHTNIQSGYASDSSWGRTLSIPSTKLGVTPTKYLSPVAPPFVPNNTPASASADHAHIGNTASPGNGTTSGRVDSPSSTLLPVCHEDIEYIDRLGLNPVDGEKLYCSTVSEIQEVVRRVREQAKKYGCEGGQSKDPEYDAEQDVRWAMADFQPIPLPEPIPDHISKPRAWDWADSAFNIHAKAKKVPTEFYTNLSAKPNPKIGNFFRARRDSWNSNYSTEINAKKDIGCKDEPLVAATHHSQARNTASGSPSKPSPAVLTYQIGHNPTETNDSSHIQDFSMLGLEFQSNWPGGSEDGWDTPPTSPKKSTVPSAVKVPPTEMENTMTTVPATDRNLKARKAANEKVAKSSNRHNQATVEDTGKNSHFSTNLTFKAAPIKEEKRESTLVKNPFAKDSDNRSDTSWDDTADQGSKNAHAATAADIIKILKETNSSHLPVFLESLRAEEAKKLQSIQKASAAMEKGTTGFLRDMLKSPRYSASQHKQETPHNVAPAEWQMRRHPEADGGWAKRSTNKENVSDQWQPNTTTTMKGNRSSSSASTSSWAPDARNNKAQPSRGTSTYQARSLMPQYDGAGDSYSSNSVTSSHAARGILPQHDGARDSLPSGALTNSREYHTQTPLGWKEKGAPISYRHTNVFPSNHHDAIDHFFHDLREKERNEVLQHQGIKKSPW